MVRGAPDESRKADAMAKKSPQNPERERLDQHRAAWRRWGPYLSERAWGTVREDYSPGGTAWEYLPHDHARSRAYRWNEDGMAGICDDRQRLCLALALWNGEDPILKERMFGLTGNQGNHGEDVKEYWWFLDATPSHSWLRWRYHYPQRAFPYTDLVAENGRRGKLDPEYELLDTGAFDDDRYWIVEVHYAKATPDDLLMRVTARNAGPEPAELHVLPTLWLRNTWSWDFETTRPELRVEDGAVIADVDDLGRWVLRPGPGPDRRAPELLVCENETNTRRLFGIDSGTAFPKDGIGDHVIHGAPTVDPDGVGTKAAAWYRIAAGPGEEVELRLRLWQPAAQAPQEPLGRGFASLMKTRRAEADAFYAALTPEGTSDEDAMIMRQAFAGLIWSQQWYHYDVARWLEGDPAQPPPPGERQHGRNSGWRHLHAADVIIMPDPWEYPWFAAWDLAFHAIAYAHLDPGYAKDQLLLLCREWYQHPSGALPAYEWSFSDVNPPLQAWAALKIWMIDGGRDHAFLERVFLKLLVNFTWWVNVNDAAGDGLFEGGFLGLDNISAIDRSNLPPGWRLEQADATAWMGQYSLMMLALAGLLAHEDEAYEDFVVKFSEHFTAIAHAMDREGLWNEQDGLFYDQLIAPDGTVTALRIPTIVGVVPMLPAAVVDTRRLRQALTDERRALRRLQVARERGGSNVGRVRGVAGDDRVLVSIVDPAEMRQIAANLFDESEFLSPHGIRAISARLRDEPVHIPVPGGEAVVDYEPAESTSGMFGGNSNWRGPVWMPMNYLVVDHLARLGEAVGDDAHVEYPTGSGVERTIAEIADDLRQRLIGIWRRGPDGRRPVYGWVQRLQEDPEWRDNLLFFEYFHGDNGAGLGAMHQTGWTALVADLIAGRDLRRRIIER